MVIHGKNYLFYQGKIAEHFGSSIIFGHLSGIALSRTRPDAGRLHESRPCFIHKKLGVNDFPQGFLQASSDSHAGANFRQTTRAAFLQYGRGAAFGRSCSFLAGLFLTRSTDSAGTSRCIAPRGRLRPRRGAAEREAGDLGHEHSAPQTLRVGRRSRFIFRGRLRLLRHRFICAPLRRAAELTHRFAELDGLRRARPRSLDDSIRPQRPHMDGDRRVASRYDRFLRGRRPSLASRGTVFMGIRGKASSRSVSIRSTQAFRSLEIILHAFSGTLVLLNVPNAPRSASGRFLVN
jgi:hypothetical protein